MSRRAAEVAVAAPEAERSEAAAAEDSQASQAASGGVSEEPATVAPRQLDPAVQLAELRRRVAADSRDTGARRELARLLAGRGELTMALEQYEAARTLAPEDPTLVLEVAETLVALRRFDPAERELRRLIKFQPDNGAAHLQLGIANLRRGLYAQAEQDLERATALLPNTALAFFYRGEALNQLDRVDDALANMERAVQLDPTHARAYYVMGILYDKKNLPQEAAALYRKAREAGAR